MEHFQENISLPLLPGPWIEFQEQENPRPRFCQPDGLLFDPWTGRIILLEVKYQHTPDAWWQLRKLYAPVIEYLFPHYEVACVEVVKWFDPAVVFPERPALLKCPMEGDPSRLGVHIWRP